MQTSHDRFGVRKRLLLSSAALCVLLTAWGYAEERDAGRGIQPGDPRISIGPVLARGTLLEPIDDSDTQLTFCDQLATELLRKYRCYVLSRTRSYDIAVEDTIQSLSTIDGLNRPSDKIMSADFAIAANFTTVGEGAKIEGYVFV